MRMIFIKAGMLHGKNHYNYIRNGSWFYIEKKGFETLIARLTKGKTNGDQRPTNSVVVLQQD